MQVTDKTYKGEKQKYMREAEIQTKQASNAKHKEISRDGETDFEKRRVPGFARGTNMICVDRQEDRRDKARFRENRVQEEKARGRRDFCNRRDNF